MTTIENLSNEVIYIILQQKIISIEDVVSFGLTCRRFLNAICHNNTLWQMKVYQRWPHMERIYDKRIQNKERINFKDDVKASIKCRNELRSHLSLMSERFFQKDNFSESDVEHFDALFCPNMGAHIMNYYFLKDEMIHMITMSSLLPDCNLTHKYYSRELLLYLQQRHTKDVWQEFISYPKEQQLLEEAATIAAQWYQPQKYVFYFEVVASLDNIAQLVLKHLKKVHWDHPIFSISAKQFSFWKNNNINDNQWNKKEEEQIINMLQIVLFDELGFSGLASNVLYKLENILIDCVLENKVGDAVSLAIIFQSVARRLGVRCNLVAFPTHFFLSWKPKSITEKSEDEECFCIDILHGGAMVGFTHRNDCPRTRGRRCPIENFNKHNEISPTEVVLRMIYHLQMVNPDYQHYQDRTLQIRSLMEFRYMINPYNIDAIQELGRNYMQNQMNLSGLLISLQKILNSEIVAIEAMRAEELLNKFKLYMQKKMTRPSLENISPPKVRCNIKYAIGMIVTFKKYVPNYTGVIIGWDKRYNLRDLSNPELKIIDMLEFNCVLQPFYFILSEDGNKYYAPEDSLIETCPPRWIEHNEIGRYFCRFARTHYVPNEVLKRQYMFDELVLDGL
ncbi:PREDICTED: F-box only protein 21-like isoform X2 [Trachymyrmex septentrionalis]|uniref:F-box only protein 21-like isoform X2 n=1 Tax=Trachymyrmex septentrionalis TaxID=34720 RepID=UPI00084EFF9C|nr:PREDICTED: F-box only protein 21-like isoform X2 [Trachymyrmex septentrionalis]